MHEIRLDPQVHKDPRTTYFPSSYFTKQKICVILIKIKIKFLYKKFKFKSTNLKLHLQLANKWNTNWHNIQGSIHQSLENEIHKSYEHIENKPTHIKTHKSSIWGRFVPPSLFNDY